MESAKAESTYFTFDKDKKLYRYFTLLSIDKRQAVADFRLFTLEKELRAFQPVMAEIMQQAQRKEGDSIGRQHAVYEDISRFAAKSISAEAIEKLNAAREFRKGGQFAKAIPLLEKITREEPGFYLAWFNLGLAHDKSGDVPPAELAYLKAIKLEPSQPRRDPSIYNTYGFFLYKNGRYQDAVSQLEKALELDPEHPKARRTLEAAKRKLR